MSDAVRINNLSGITSVNSNDTFIVDTSTDTKKITFNNLCSAIAGETIHVSSELTLNSGSWNNKTQTISYTHDTNKRNIIDISINSMKEWGNCQIYAIEETSNDITFKCEEVPQNDLKFKVTSMG